LSVFLIVLDFKTKSLIGLTFLKCCSERKRTCSFPTQSC